MGGEIDKSKKVAWSVNINEFRGKYPGLWGGEGDSAGGRGQRGGGEGDSAGRDSVFRPIYKRPYETMYTVDTVHSVDGYVY